MLFDAKTSSSVEKKLDQEPCSEFPFLCLASGQIRKPLAY